MEYSVNGIVLVTDRTFQDVQELQDLVNKGLSNMSDDEKSRFLSGLKGAYNSTDIERVKNVCIFLRDKLTKIPKTLREYADSLGVAWDIQFDVPYTTPLPELNDWANVSWGVTDMMTATDRITYLSDIKILGETFKVVVPSFPVSMNGLTVYGANAIEKTLGELELVSTDFEKEKIFLILSASQSWVYSGEIFADELENMEE